MKGTIQVKRLRDSAAFYTVKDYDELYGGDFTYFIEPFRGCDGELFYYVKELDNGKLEIEGEAYVITDKDSLNRHKREAKKELDGEIPLYRWLDKNGKVINLSYK